MNLQLDAPVEVNRIYRSNSIITILEQALFSLIRLSISPYLVLPFYLKQLTESTFLIGLIPAVFVIGFALPQFLMVRILRRTRRPMRLLVLSALGQRLGMLGMFLLTVFQIRLPNAVTISLFFAVYLFFNIARGCYSPTQIDFLGRGIPNNRGKIIGLGNFLGGILNLLGTLLLTGLLTKLPYPQAITAVMGISLAGSLVSFIAILFLRDVQLAGGDHFPAGNLAHENKALPSPAFRKYLSWRAVIIGLEMMLPFYTLYGLDKFALPVSYVGIFAAIMTVSDAVGNPFWGWLGDRIGYLRIIILASALGCAAAILSAIAPNVIIFSLVFLLNGLMISGQSLSGVNIIYEFSPRREVPLYVAFHQVLLSILSSLAPVLGASLTGGLGYAYGSLVAGATGFLGTLGMQLKAPLASSRQDESSRNNHQGRGFMKTTGRDIATLEEKYPEYIAQVKKHYRWNYILFILESSAFCVSLAIFSPDTILPLLVSTLSAHPFFIGLIPAINYLGYYLPQIAGAYLLQGRQTRKEVVFRITIFQRIATLLVTLVVQSIPGFPAEITLLLFFISYTLFSLTNGMIGPPYSDLTNKTIIYNRGVYFGVLSGVTGLVGFVTSLLARNLLDGLPYPQNFHVMFWLACGVSLLSPIFVAAFRETPFPETRPVEPLGTYLKAIPSIIEIALKIPEVSHRAHPGQCSIHGEFLLCHPRHPKI